MSIFDWLLNPSGLTPHGFCLSWAPGLVALHASSDAMIGLAYLSIPLALAAFARQRRDLKYTWVLYLFVAFIVACGATHLMSILTLWVPAYGIEGLIKLATALLSIATAAILWPLIPALVAAPSPAQLERLNTELAASVAELEATAALLRESETRVRLNNLELERRVAEQTAELRDANTQLTEALAQRDILLREVYHRVKNNLQIVDALLVMESLELADPGAKTVLANLRQRVFALGLVHQQLMKSDDLETFDIAPFLRELSTNIVEGAGRAVTLSVDAVAMKVGLDFAIPLGLLVTELVTNALKHAFPNGGGSISVKLERKPAGEVALIVADDGQGIAKARSKAGASKSGLGAGLIEGLAAQMNGTLTISRKNGMRTEIRLAAPVRM